MIRLRIIILSLVFGVFVSCESDNNDAKKDADPIKDLIILYTNDEHGWMEETNVSDGAAKMMGVWRENEGYTEEGPYLILSGGDNWTGPAISTWFKGESMVEVMNAMNYTASAIGNHEFDVKLDGLFDRVEDAEFPYLSANVFIENDETPSFALPYLVKEVNGISVGIIGLTTTTTPYSTFPDNVATLHFDDYAISLEHTVPIVKDAGAELIIVIAHICSWEMSDLVPTLSTLGVSVIGGGHCHELYAQKVQGIGLIEGGSSMRSYAKVVLSFDTEADTVLSMAVSTESNENGSADATVSAVISSWRTLADQELNEVIGYAENFISGYSNEMHNMVTDSWLAGFPTADIAITNSGGIRQGIPAGDITKETIIGVLPFDNNIIELELTGTELIDCLGNFILGGMYVNNGYFLSDSTEIIPDSSYRVLTTDYLYARHDYNFYLYDTNPYYTGMNYSQPTIDWILTKSTNSGDPLENYLDPNVRN